jgi:hypothetical protein
MFSSHLQARRQATPAPTAVWLSLMALLGAGAAAPVPATPAATVAPARLEIRFPPPPPPAELQPRDAGERTAGVIILHHVLDVRAGVAEDGPFTEEFHQLRYLVLDEVGATAVEQHVFFSPDNESYELVELAGRTLSPDGEITPLDLERDVLTLDARSFEGRSTVPLRSVTFPRVESGAVLDLAYRTRVSGYQRIRLIRLQRDFPTREIRLSTSARLDDDMRWVPFRFAALPAGATATLSPQMDLTLTATDAPALRTEPLAPPEIRTQHLLALIARPVTPQNWREHLHLWAGAPPQLDATGAAGIVQPPERPAEIDALGLQRLPRADEVMGLEAMIDSLLADIDRDEATFLRRRRRAESTAQIERIAPRELPWYERAERLFVHARQRITPEPGHRNAHLDRALNSGAGQPIDTMLYFQLLLDRASLENRRAVVLSRKAAPFAAPIGELAIHDPLLVVEVGTPPVTRYYPIIDRYAGPSAFSDVYLGAIVFRREAPPLEAPARQSEPERWSVGRVPLTTPVYEFGVIRLTSDIPLNGEPTSLSMRLYLEGAAARYARIPLRLAGDGDHAFGAPVQDYAHTMLEDWAGVSHEDHVRVASDPTVSPLEPLAIALESTWSPEVQPLDDALLVPALPPAWRTRNPFTDEQRTQPLWLEGGQYDLRMRWRVPTGYRLAGDPQVLERNGPNGLYFSLSVEAGTGEDGSDVVLTRLAMNQPYIIAASDYPEVRSFFEALQRESDRLLLLERITEPTPTR